MQSSDRSEATSGTVGTMETCPTCPFAWDAISPAEVGPRIIAVTEQFSQLLRDHAETATQRPADSTWSMLEYGCHVRDVLFNLRDRVILGAAEDNPTPKPLHPDARVDLGLYAADQPEQVADELSTAAALFSRTFDALPSGYELRPIFYAWPVATTRTLGWVGAQALHECEHHYDDVRAQT